MGDHSQRLLCSLNVVVGQPSGQSSKPLIPKLCQANTFQCATPSAWPSRFFGPPRSGPSKILGHMGWCDDDVKISYFEEFFKKIKFKFINEIHATVYH